MVANWIDRALAQIAPGASRLRDRMRDLTRNNPHAAKAVAVLVNNIVGAGIRPRAATGTDALDNRVNELWEAWATRADADGLADFHGLTTLAVREMIEGGDVFMRHRIRRRVSARSLRRRAGAGQTRLEIMGRCGTRGAARPHA